MSDVPTSTTATTETETPSTETTTPEVDAAEASPPSLLGTEVVEDKFDPEKLVLPEGFTPGEGLDEFKSIAAEHGLKGSTANALIALHGKWAKSASEQSAAAWVAQNETWQAEVKADKEVGGAKLDGFMQTFSKVANNPELSDPEFRRALLSTGAGNHPAIVRTLFKWAAALGEGGPISGGVPARNGNGQLASQQVSIADAIYGPNGPHTGGPVLR